MAADKAYRPYGDRGDESGRFVLWLPVFLASGIAVYFALPFEPPLFPAVATAVLLLAAAYVLRGRYEAALVLVALAVVSAGLAAARIETRAIDTRFIDRERGPLTVTGLVQSAEPASVGARLTISDLKISGLEPYETPERIRITSRSRAAADIRAGDWIKARAKISPPSPPVYPGGFDFRRHAYFEGLGATGFTFGAPEIVRPAGETGAGIAIERFRYDVARRIMVAAPPETAPIAVALLTGYRLAIPDETADAMRDSGLAHLLAISGLHVGLVTGLIFYLVRAFLAAIPGFALHHPIKKWSAFAALFGALGYMLLAGASVPTQRAFVMSAFVLTAVMIDRRGITLRLVAWAALAILIMAPHALMGAGFQMSFAAVVALVAVYERLGSGFRRAFPPNASLGRKALGYVAGVALSTLVAGAANAPFALFHFQQAALYGLPANLLAVPVTALWVLPSGLAAMLAMPFGWEAGPLALMGEGIGLVLGVARHTAAWPHAVTHVPALPDGFAVCIAAAGLLAAIGRSRLKWAAIVPALAAAVMVAMVRSPDLFVAADGNVIAWREPGGLVALGPERTRYRFERAALERASALPQTAARASRRGCDEVGCRFARNGRSVSVLWHEAGLIEDCWDTDVLIATVPVRRMCPGPDIVIDRFDLGRTGGISLTLGEGGTVHVETVADRIGARPWTRSPSTGGSDRPTAPAP